MLDDPNGPRCRIQGMSDTIKARFVGGPKHNDVIEVSRLHEIRVAVQTRSFAEMLAWTDNQQIAQDSYRCESYRLCRFVSEGSAYYAQYIHESLMQRGEPARETYRDAEFPRMPAAYFDLFALRLIRAFRNLRLP